MKNVLHLKLSNQISVCSLIHMLTINFNWYCIHFGFCASIYTKKKNLKKIIDFLWKMSSNIQTHIYAYAICFASFFCFAIVNSISTTKISILIYRFPKHFFLFFFCVFWSWWWFNWLFLQASKIKRMNSRFDFWIERSRQIQYWISAFGYFT